MAAEGDKQPDAHQHTLRISSHLAGTTFFNCMMIGSDEDDNDDAIERSI